MKGWFGQKQKHSLASKGIRTNIRQIGNRKYGWQVIWKQEDKSGKIKQYKEVFENKNKAEEHKRKLLISAESIKKPIEILNIGEVIE